MPHQVLKERDDLGALDCARVQSEVKTLLRPVVFRKRCFWERRSNRLEKSQGSVVGVLLTIQAEQYPSHQIIDRLIPFGWCRKNLLLRLHVL